MMNKGKRILKLIGNITADVIIWIAKKLDKEGK